MMNYDLFKTIAEERILEFLPSKYRAYEISVNKVKRVNRTVDCLNLFPPAEGSEGEAKASPNVYLDEMYEEFKKCQDLNLVLRRMAASIDAAFRQIPQGAASVDFAQWKNRIVVNTINTAENHPLLEELPHREFLDLSIIYRFIMNEDESGFYTVRVDHGIMESLGLTEAELFELAMENTRRMFPMVVETMGFGGELFEEFMGIHCITNRRHIQGASCILFSDQLRELAQKLKQSFFLIPSSVHELIAVPESLGEASNLQTTLRFANTQPYVGKDKLSDRVYFYDKNTETLTFAC